MNEQPSVSPEQMLWREICRAHLYDACGYQGLCFEQQIEATRLARTDAFAFMNGRRNTTTEHVFNMVGIDTDVAALVVCQMHARGWHCATPMTKQFGIDHIVGPDGKLLFIPKGRLLSLESIHNELARAGVHIDAPTGRLKRKKVAA